MKRVLISHLEKASRVRPRGYFEEAIKAGKIEGETILFSDEAYQSLRNRYSGKPAWPKALLPLKLLAKSGDRGAGDIIARTIGPIGGNAFKMWYRKIFGKDCGCGQRQESLNARWPI